MSYVCEEGFVPRGGTENGLGPRIFSPSGLFQSHPLKKGLAFCGYLKSSFFGPVRNIETQKLSIGGSKYLRTR